MFTSLKARLAVVGLLIVMSVAALWRNHRLTAGPNRPGQIVNLGLDLQGGTHLALERDPSAAPSADPSKDLEAALAVLRKRVDQLGVLEPLTQLVGKDRIVIELPGFHDAERAKEIVRRSAYLEFRIADESGALDRALPAMDRALRAAGFAAERRGPDSPVDQILGTSDSTTRSSEGPLSQLLARAGEGLPGEYLVAESSRLRADSLLGRPEVRRLWPRGLEFRWSADSITSGRVGYRYLYVLEDRPILTGTGLLDARAQLDPMTNGSEVAFSLDRASGRRFGQETGRHIGDYLAIVLDGKVEGRPPVINGRIEREGRIQMAGKPLAEAQDLALVLRAGALPVPLVVVEERQVGPTLGFDSIQGGLNAGIVGTAAVVVMVVGYYAWSGVLAILALSLYTLFTFAALALFGASLTLPGLAGFVLSIGIAVDANVLIFERIREERGAGKPVGSAISSGFRHAMPAIIDSNLTTILTALFLFQFGTGPVKGFAVTLIIGIFASMVTAVFVTRTFYQAWLHWRPNPTEVSVGRLRLFQHAAFDFIANRRFGYRATALVMVVGALFLGSRGIQSSVEFTGGTLIQFRTTEPVDEAALRQGLRQHGIDGAELQRFGSNREFVMRVGLGAADSAGPNVGRTTAAVKTALSAVVGPDRFSIERAEGIGPKVGGELRQRAVLAILFSFGAVLAYLAFRFEWRFGLAAVIATAHDILLTIAFISVMNFEFSLVLVAAILTVVGYSLNDTIVIFDRVRENLRAGSRRDLVGILNRSANETLPRTVLTGGTALATLVALAVFGGEVIRPFAMVMFFGILTGTFSSIFIASPVLLWVERRWPRGGLPPGGKPELAPAAVTAPVG